MTFALSPQHFEIIIRCLLTSLVDENFILNLMMFQLIFLSFVVLKVPSLFLICISTMSSLNMGFFPCSVYKILITVISILYTVAAPLLLEFLLRVEP